MGRVPVTSALDRVVGQARSSGLLVHLPDTKMITQVLNIARFVAPPLNFPQKMIEFAVDFYAVAR